jgi:hypothetical protein
MGDVSIWSSGLNEYTTLTGQSPTTPMALSNVVGDSKTRLYRGSSISCCSGLALLMDSTKLRFFLPFRIVELPKRKEMMMEIIVWKIKEKTYIAKMYVSGWQMPRPRSKAEKGEETVLMNQRGLELVEAKERETVFGKARHSDQLNVVVLSPKQTELNSNDTCYRKRC